MKWYRKGLEKQPKEASLWLNLGMCYRRKKDWGPATEALQHATELDPDIKVMFITGFAAVALNPDSAAPKDAKVLSKPFHLKDLVNEVDKLLKAA